ncbi:acylneuraminate cytidylyltransferase family protein [Thiohalobacter sp. IOR34]|uniref:acylneuraminate cytidylyltransferase family protein n=1 Tax=Thiohalobacter sp. IOR34 TaxID=3057176 RepID=UPI0025B19360|nr:acylneuraminate cytidylyltransferase family protein [Thiohalobacter sp. IOR34]WJW76705.1 acylneuraminate cytidylyltransferase family protein [Thiohalobacter sp. IOR34]
MAGKTLGVIPARGGSKSIPHKNITEFCGRPLIEHVIEAGLRCSLIDELVCSTDDDKIAAVVESMGVRVIPRPAELAQDDTPVLDVLKDLMLRHGDRIDIVPLLQPTSPFLLPEHIDACVAAMKNDPECDSAQTVSRFPHNYHAYNQRVVEDGYVSFRFRDERLACYNKQSKPRFHIFGNLVVTRKRTLMEKNEIFGERSIAIEVPQPYAFDLDTKEDIAYGQFLLERGQVCIPWL